VSLPPSTFFFFFFLVFACREGFGPRIYETDCSLLAAPWSRLLVLHPPPPTTPPDRQPLPDDPSPWLPKPPTPFRFTGINPPSVRPTPHLSDGGCLTSSSFLFPRKSITKCVMSLRFLNHPFRFFLVLHVFPKAFSSLFYGVVFWKRATVTS